MTRSLEGQGEVTRRAGRGHSKGRERSLEGQGEVK